MRSIGKYWQFQYYGRFKRVSYNTVFIRINTAAFVYFAANFPAALIREQPESFGAAGDNFVLDRGQRHFRTFATALFCR